MSKPDEDFGIVSDEDLGIVADEPAEAPDLPDDVEPASPLGRAMAQQPGDIVDVDDPETGKMRFTRSGQRVLSDADIKASEGDGARARQAKLTGLLATLNSGSNGLLERFSSPRNAATARQATKEGGLGYELLGKAPQMLVNPGSALGRVGLSAATTGAEAALKSQEHPVRDGLVGAGIGAAGGLAGEGIGKAAASLAPAAKKYAREAAIRAADPTKRQATKILNLGLGADVADDILEQATMFGGKEKAGANVAAELERRGAALGQHTNDLGETLPSVIAERIETDVVKPWRAKPSTEAQRAADYAAEQAASIESKYGKGTMSLTDAERILKGDYADAAAKAASTNDSTGVGLRDVKADIYRAIKRQNEDLARAGEEVMREEALAGSRTGKKWLAKPTPEQEAAANAIPGTFEKLKRGYGSIAEANRMFSGGNAKALTNPRFPQSELTVNLNMTPDAAPASETAAETIKGLMKSPVKTTLSAVSGPVGRFVGDRAAFAAPLMANKAAGALKAAAPYLPQTTGRALAAGGSSALNSIRPQIAETLRRPKDQQDEEAVSAWLDGGL